MANHRSIKAFLPKAGRPARVTEFSPGGLSTRRSWADTDWFRWLFAADPKQGIVAARELREVVVREELRHVRGARARGWTWESIALLAGIKRQTAHAKWSHRIAASAVRYPAAMSLDDLYREVILDHYRSPRNKRALDGAGIDVHRNNPLCGDDITVRVAVKDGVAVDAAFEGVGCSISQASASMMTEQIKGKSLEEIDGLVTTFRSMMGGEDAADEDALGDLVALKGVTKYPVRIKCAVLAWDALQAGVTGGE